MKNAKGKMIAVLTGIGIALTTLVGQARADNIDNDWGEWWSVYSQDGVWLFDYCKCVEGAHECRPCETYVGTLIMHGITQPTYEQKKTSGE